LTGSQNGYSQFVDVSPPTSAIMSILSDSTVPIRLLSFEAKEVAGLVNLKWATPGEYNNAYFLLERSKDGQIFDSLTFLPGENNPYQHQYEYVDRQPIAGTSYYRLSQTDFAGKKSYAPMIAVEVTNAVSANGMILFPNPNRSRQLGLRMEGVTGGDRVTIILWSMQGARVAQYAATVDPSGQFPLLDLGMLASGVYVVEANTQPPIRKLLVVE